MSEQRTHVRLETLEPGIALLELNRPASRNALSAALVTDVRDAARELAEDRSVRVVILHGAGRGFCAGADLAGEDPAGSDRLPGTQGMGQLGYVYKMQEHLARMIAEIHEIPKPVIAAVHGAAVGGGLALALASDIRVAADNAKFGSVFIKVGLSSCDVGTSYFLPRLIGPARAFELMITGRHFGAAEAERIGLVHRVVAEGEEIEAALESARPIVANNEYGTWMTKVGMWANLEAPSLRHAMEMENRTQVLGYFTGNMEEAMKAFQEKREPIWKPL